MGHYLSEMQRDPTPEEIKKIKRKAAEKEQMVMKLCKALGIKRGEIKLLQEIIEESWMYSDDMGEKMHNEGKGGKKLA